MPAVRAAVRPAAVQRSEHSMLVAHEQSHLHPISISIPLPAPHPPADIDPFEAPTPIWPKDVVEFCLKDPAVRTTLMARQCADPPRLPCARSRILLDLKKPIYQALPSFSVSHRDPAARSPDRRKRFPPGTYKSGFTQNVNLTRSDDMQTDGVRHAMPNYVGTTQVDRSPTTAVVAGHTRRTRRARMLSPEPRPGRGAERASSARLRR